MKNKKSMLKKQLAAAIAMVLVAGLALGSSTFAWFVNNTQVKAQGMTVNAVASGSLVIKGNDDGAFTSIGTTTIGDALYPVTSKDGLNFAQLASDVKVQSANNFAASWTGEDGEFVATDLETVAGTNLTHKIITAQYDIASVGQAAEIYVESVNLSKNFVEKALRMSVTIGEDTYVYNIGGGTADLVGKLTVSSEEGEVTEVWSLEAPEYTAVNDNTAKWALTEATADSIGDGAVTATVNVWYEGQDTQCYSSNIDAAGTAISINFAQVQ